MTDRQTEKGTEHTSGKGSVRIYSMDTLPYGMDLSIVAKAVVIE